MKFELPNLSDFLRSWLLTTVTAVLSLLAVYLLFPFTVMGTILTIIIILFAWVIWTMNDTLITRTITFFLVASAFTASTLAPFIFAPKPVYILARPDLGIHRSRIETIRTVDKVFGSTIILSDYVRIALLPILESLQPLRIRTVHSWFKRTGPIFQLPLRGSLTITNPLRSRFGISGRVTAVRSIGFGIALSSRDLRTHLNLRADNHIDELARRIEYPPITRSSWKEVSFRSASPSFCLEYTALLDLAIESFITGKNSEAIELGQLVFRH